MGDPDSAWGCGLYVLCKLCVCVYVCVYVCVCVCVYYSICCIALNIMCVCFTCVGVVREGLPQH